MTATLVLPPPSASATRPAAFSALPERPEPALSAEAYAALIHIAARQRMLSQRVVLFALLAVRGDPDALAVAQESLALFRGSHATLSRGRDGVPGPFNDELRSAFFGPLGADAAITTFIRIADDALQDVSRHSPSAERRVQTLVGQATPILTPLNRLLQTYEGQARRQAGAG